MERGVSPTSWNHVIKWRTVLRRAACKTFSLMLWPFTTTCRIVDRYACGKHIAQELRNARIALVWHAELITKLAENTAVNRGGRFRIFADRAVATAWLEDSP